jgi:SAM-dependent methyltransferase
MPLVLNPLEHLLLLTLNRAPGPILDLYGGTAQRVVLAGIRLRVFETLRQEPAGAQALAQRLTLDARGTDILLGTLAALGYLQRDGEQFRLAAMTRKWLTDAEGSNLAPYFLFWDAMQEHLFPKLEDSIRTGQPPENLYDWLASQPEVSHDFQEGLAAFARLYGEGIAHSIPVPSRPCRLLDVGGGHAAYSIALCQKYPQLTAVILDGAQALSVGRQSIEAAHLNERVTVQEGDFVTDPLPRGFDLALIFNILHGFPAEQNRALLGKVKAALNPGGRVVIMDQLVGKSGSPIAETIARVMSLSFFHMVGGQIYTYDEMQRWLTQAGFGNIELKRGLKVGLPLLFAESL